MWLLWTFGFVFSAVNCYNVNENYIIERPDIDAPKAYNTPFKVYWNIPTKQCRSKKIPFDDLLHKFMITYNKDDRFEGETITIIYDVGLIPSILRSDGAKYSVQNEGLPQEGNLELHMAAFRETVVRNIPDPNFNGIGVLNMESWRPIFRQHWNSAHALIVDLSLSIEKRRHWWWPAKWQKMEATKRFEDAARIFMEKTLSTAKQMRPKAVWGFYGLPYCFNMEGRNNNVEHCSNDVKVENDRTYWLWAESTALYPSLYSNPISTSDLKKLVKGRLTEANRLKEAGDLVLPYFSTTYRKGGFFKEMDVNAVFDTLQNQNASGLIVWGASGDVNTVKKCNQLYNYINRSFGPIAKKFIQRINNIRDNKIQKDTTNTANTDSYDILNKATNVQTTTRTTTFNIIQENTIPYIISTTPKYDSVNHSYEQENQLHKYFYETDNNKVELNSLNDTDIWSVQEYETSTKNENITKTINKLFIGNPSTTAVNTTFNKRNLQNSDVSTTENYLSLTEIKAAEDFNNKSTTLIKSTDNTIYSLFEPTNNTKLSNQFSQNITQEERLIQNISCGIKTTAVLTPTVNKLIINGSDTEITLEGVESVSNIDFTLLQSNKFSKNSLQIVKQEEQLIKNATYHTNGAIASRKNNVSDYLMTSAVDFPSFINISMNGTDTEIRNNYSKNISQSVKQDLIEQDVSDEYPMNDNNTKVTNSYAKDIPQNSKEEEDLIMHTIYSNNNSSGSVKIDVSDYLITITKDITRPIVSMNGNYTKKKNNCSKNTLPNDKCEEELIKNVTSSTIEATASRENGKTDYSITLAVDFSNPNSSFLNSNVTKITLENLEQASSLDLTLLPPSNYSKHILQNGKQKEQFIKNATYPNNEATANRKVNVSDLLITAAVGSPSLTNISMNGTDTRITNNYSKNISQNVKEEHQSIEDTTYSNIEATNSGKNDVDDYLTTSTEVDLTSPMRISMNDSDTKIKNSNAKHISQNFKQEEFTNYTIYSNSNSSGSGENDVSDYLITITKDFTRPIVSMNGNNTEKTNNCSKDTSKNVKCEEQLIKNTTSPNIEATASEKNSVSDYFIRLAEDLT